MNSRALTLLVVPLLALVAGCGSAGSTGGAGSGAANTGNGSTAAAVEPPDYPPDDSLETCDSFTTWRDAQDALDVSDYSDTLDPDGDGVACADELGQPEYETGWDTGYEESCSWIFDQSSTGNLYDDSGTEYSDLDCSNADPGASAWAAAPNTEPEDTGSADGWISACEETFGTVTGYSDLQLADESVYVTQGDCEAASSY